jgi:hypothetical protein
LSVCRGEDAVPERGTVEVSIASIERAWRAAGYDDFWLKLRTVEHLDLGLVQASADDANAATERQGMELKAYSLTPCPGGFAVEIGPALEREQVRSWVQHFTDALERRGLIGRLGGATSVLEPKILDASQPPTPTLFARFRLPPNLADGKPQWEVGDEQTGKAVSTTLNWALSDPGEVILTQDLFSVRVEDLDLQPPLERALRAAGNAGVEVVDSRAQRARHAVLGPNAAVLYQVIGESWQATIEELHDLALKMPGPLDYAFVRIAQRGSFGINALDSVQPLPGLREMHVRYAPHVLDRFLPDAHGIQIVTDAHLQGAHNLSEWRITELGRGNHLVEAPDREPWYSTTMPDKDTLARARADWAGSLLTQELSYASRKT